MTQASPGRPRSGAVVATVLARRSPRGRYGVLLLVLIASYVLSAFNRLQWVADLQIAFFLAVLLLALHASPLSRRLPGWPLPSRSQAPPRPSGPR